MLVAGVLFEWHYADPHGDREYEQRAVSALVAKTRDLFSEIDFII